MKLLTPAYDVSIIYSKLIFKTVEVEITAIMPLQRTCGAESQVRNKLSNGPLRAQSNVIATEYSATLRQTLFAGGSIRSRSAHGLCRESRWHRG